MPFRAGAHKKEPLAPQPGIARHVILARIGAHWLVPGDFGENIRIPSQLVESKLYSNTIGI
jgi:hypothetical protein